MMQIYSKLIFSVMILLSTGFKNVPELKNLPGPQIQDIKLDNIKDHPGQFHPSLTNKMGPINFNHAKPGKMPAKKKEKTAESKHTAKQSNTKKTHKSKKVEKSKPTEAPEEKTTPMDNGQSLTRGLLAKFEQKNAIKLTPDFESKYEEPSSKHGKDEDQNSKQPVKKHRKHHKHGKPVKEPDEEHKKHGKPVKKSHHRKNLENDRKMISQHLGKLHPEDMKLIHYFLVLNYKVAPNNNMKGEDGMVRFKKSVVKVGGIEVLQMKCAMLNLASVKEYSGILLTIKDSKNNYVPLVGVTKDFKEYWLHMFHFDKSFKTNDGVKKALKHTDISKGVLELELRISPKYCHKWKSPHYKCIYYVQNRDNVYKAYHRKLHFKDTNCPVQPKAEENIADKAYLIINGKKIFLLKSPVFIVSMCVFMIVLVVGCSLAVWKICLKKKEDSSTLKGSQSLKYSPSGALGANRPSGALGANRPSGALGPNRPSGALGPNRPSGALGPNRPPGVHGSNYQQGVPGSRRASGVLEPRLSSGRSPTKEYMNIPEARSVGRRSRSQEMKVPSARSSLGRKHTSNVSARGSHVSDSIGNRSPSGKPHRSKEADVIAVRSSSAKRNKVPVPPKHIQQDDSLTSATTSNY